MRITDPPPRGVDCLSAIGWQIDTSHAEQYSIISGGAGAAIGAAAYGIGQIFYGDEINGWIDRNARFDGGILNQLRY